MQNYLCQCPRCQGKSANSQMAEVLEQERGNRRPPSSGQRRRRRRGGGVIVDPAVAAPHVDPPPAPASAGGSLVWPFDPSVRVAPGWWLGPANGKGFGARRGEGRIHAACDLVVAGGKGTPIRAIADGVVLQNSPFYLGTWALVVLHHVPGMRSFVVRYGENLSPAAGGIAWSKGDRVTAGQVVAKMGRFSSGSSMLHFELYATDRDLSCRSLSIASRLYNKPNRYTEEQKQNILRAGWHWDFQRRIDLANPTEFLQALQQGRRPNQPVPFRPMAGPLCGAAPAGTPSNPPQQSPPQQSPPRPSGGSPTTTPVPAGTQGPSGLASLAQLSGPQVQPTVANALSIVRVLSTANCLAWRIPFAVLEHEGGVRLFGHHDGVMQTTDAVKGTVIRQMSRALKLSLLGLPANAPDSDEQINGRVRAEFPRRLAVQIACGVQELVMQLKRFNGYVALALIAYNTGGGNATKVVTQGRRPIPTGDAWETECRFAASLYHQADAAIRVTSPGVWQCDKNIPAWFQHYAVFDRQSNRQLIGYKYLRSFQGCIAGTPPAKAACTSATHATRQPGSGEQVCRTSRRGVLEKIYAPALLGKPYRDAVAGLLSPLTQDGLPLAVRNCRLVKFPLVSGNASPIVLGD